MSAIAQPIVSAADAIKQKLAQLLQFGKGGKPAPAGPPIPTNPDNTYPRDPSDGLLRRGAATAVAPVMATPQGPTDNTDPNKPPPQTLTPITPQASTNSSTSPTGGAAPPKQPYQTDQDWAAANPGAVPSLTPQPDKLTIGQKLKDTFAYGMPFWDARKQQAAQAATDQRNYPQTLHAAREKEELAAATLQKTRSEAANFQSEADERGQPKPVTLDPRKQLEADFIKQTQANDPQAKTTEDMLHRLYPQDFKAADDAEMAKIPPPILAQVGPKPTTPSFSMPGQPPHLYTSTEEAQAAWGKAIGDTTQTAEVALAGAKKKAEEANTPHPEAEGTLEQGEDANGNPIFYNNKSGKEVAPPSGFEPKGTAAKADAAAEKQAPMEAAKDYAHTYLQGGNFTGPGDEALLEQFFELTKPSTGFRMNQNQIKILLDSRSFMESVSARAHHLISPNAPWFDDTQRQHIVKTMDDIATAKEGAQKNAHAQPASGAAPKGPAVGEVDSGYRFKGGDPAKQESWEKVQ